MIPKPVKAVKTPKRLKRGKKPARVRKTPRGKLKKLCDKAFADWIKDRDDWTCQGCGVAFREDGPLPAHAFQCAHGFSRRYHSTRWDPLNAWTLCRGCHVRWTHDPLGWDEWMMTHVDDYWGLRRRALSPAPKVDYVELLAAIARGDGHYDRGFERLKAGLEVL